LDKNPEIRHNCLIIITAPIAPLNMVLQSNDSDELRNFGNNLRRIRKEKDLSMEALANLAEIELSQIFRIETGKINPKLTTILTIARALGINPKELF